MNVSHPVITRKELRKLTAPAMTAWVSRCAKRLVWLCRRAELGVPKWFDELVEVTERVSTESLSKTQKQTLLADVLIASANGPVRDWPLAAASLCLTEAASTSAELADIAWSAGSESPTDRVSKRALSVSRSAEDFVEELCGQPGRRLFVAASKADYRELINTLAIPSNAPVPKRFFQRSPLWAEGSPILQPKASATDVDSEASIGISWDPELVTPEQLARVVAAVGDLARAEGGLGLQLIDSRGMAQPVSEVPV